MFYDSFNHKSGSGIIATNEAATVMEDDSVKPSMYEDFTEGAMVAVAESEANYTKLMMGIGIAEAVAYSETGEPMVYTEGFISDIVDKIKAFFKKLWEKIKALFKRFVLMFDQYFKNDKDFLKKYKSRILKSSTKDMTYNGYPFSKAAGLSNGSYNTDTFNDASSITSNIQDKMTQNGFTNITNGRNDGSELSEKREEIIELIRGFLLNKPTGTKIDSNDFHEEIFEFFHGSTSKETLDDSDPELNISNCIIDLEKSKEAIKTAQKALDSIGKYIDKAVKVIEDAIKTTNAEFKDDTKNDSVDNKKLSKVEKQANNTKFVNTEIAIIRDVAGAMTQLYGGYLTALKDINRQARAICAKAIVKSGKINEESASFEYFGTGTFLNSVVFK